MQTQDDQSKITLALAEAGKLKRLVGHLRSLFRDSANSRDPRLAKLKDLLVRSAASPGKSDGSATPNKVSQEPALVCSPPCGKATSPSVTESAGSPSEVARIDDVALAIIEKVLGGMKEWGDEAWDLVAELLEGAPYDKGWRL